MEGNYKELTYEEALEFYNRWGRTILVGSSPTYYYEFNKIKDKRSLDDCIKQYLNYYDGPVRFFLDQRTTDRDIQLKYKNESKNMNKKLIRLTESDLHRIVKESVNNVLSEMGTIVHPGGVTEPPKTYRVYKQYIGINYLGEEPNLIKDNATGEYIRDLVSRAKRKGIFYKDGMDSNDNYYFDIKKADMDADERIRYTIVCI